MMIMADRLEGTLGEWVRKIKASGKKYGVKVCAIAAKLARIAWRILCEKGWNTGLSLSKPADRGLRLKPENS